MHHMVPRTTSRNQVSQPSNATMIPQMTVAADLTRSEDYGSALSGTHQDELAHPVHHMAPETSSRNHGSELSNATLIPQMTEAANLAHGED